MRKRREKISCVALLLLISLSILAVYTVPAFAQQTKLYVNPPSFIDPTLTPPKTFEINIILANVTNLYSFEFKLAYDTTILDLKSVTTYPFLNEPTMQIKKEINDAIGRFWYAVTSLAPADPKSGSGTLAKLSFQVTGIGHCALDLREALLMNNEGAYITFSIADGYFDNRPPPPPALIFVDPSRIVNLTLAPCNNFTVNVSIIDASYLYSFQFKLSFDPGMLSATSAVLGNIFPSTVSPTVKINNTVGYVQFSASLKPPQTEVSGNGTLAVITFHVEGLGACKLTLSDTALADSGGKTLPHSTSDGYFNNILLAKLAVEPPEIIDPSLLPPATFEINITLADVEDLYGYQFNLSFAPGILACLSVNIHDVLNETNYTPEFITNNIKGFVWVRVTYYPPAKPITSYPPLTLVTMKFRVRGLGSTPLDLHDTSLTNSLGQPIPHEAFDGFVSIVTRDVAVIKVVPYPTQVYEGRTVYINVTVRNEGDIPETFDVSTYYDDILIGTLAVTNLAPDANTTITFNWNTHGIPPCHNYTIKAKASTVPYETDIADNVFIDGKVKIVMLGDTNADGTLNIADITITSIAFGSAAVDDPETGWNETTNWNPIADLNGDGKVNIVDIVIIGINFGKTC